MDEVILYAQNDQLNEATRHYIKTIEKAVNQLQLTMRHVQVLRDIPSDANVIVVECKSAFKISIAKPKASVWIWMQGIFPEEARWQFNSRTREHLQNFFERIAVRRAKGVILVSSAMQIHFARKYPGVRLNTFIMPCANASIQPDAFRETAKYKNPTFVYAGSLHTWQCFDLTLEVFKRVKAYHPRAKLTILTSNRSAASAAVVAHALDDVEIDFIPASLLQEKLSKFKYGFVLRRPHVVNEVATPTKVSSYMAAGVIPIITNAVHDYSKRLAEVNPLVMVDGCATTEDITQAILDVEARAIDSAMVFENYQLAFDSYFEHEIYLPTLTNFLATTGMHSKK